ncbi:MAG: hypothetical protein ACR2OG_15800 [Gemmatimonadaceae bacterium]
MPDQSHPSLWRVPGFRLYVIVTTILIVGLSVATFRRSNQRPRFQEIDVERINIVEPNGMLRMTVSDAARSPGWVFHGKVFPGRPKSAGMIFFNDEGEEDGGIGFSGRKVNGKVSADGGLSFDQYDQDEAIKLEYVDEDGRRRQGLTVNDRADIPLVEIATRMDSIEALPNGPAKDSARRALQDNHGNPLVARRLFAGRDPSKAAIVSLSDRLGHPRLRMVVDSTGVPRIEFLDGAGKVTRRISSDESPPQSH